ncbi:MAG TPA: FtsX-like permease family protein [Candidatus Polarisedimenticolia bacterium]|nr:FtsX-like permease family protein [Candidatus Polarisedimenticolia bacterium]
MFELGPIVRALIHNKGRFWLITLEIALTLAIVVNCATLMLGKYREMSRPTGMDENNILVANSEAIDAALKEDEPLEALIQEDLRLLRGQQGVIAATVLTQIPLSGSGSSTGRKRVGSTLETVSTPYYVVRDQAVAALGITIVEGRDFTEADFPEPEPEQDDSPTRAGATPAQVEIDRNNVLVTRHYAEKLFPDGGALGGELQNKDGTTVDTIVGIIERMQGSWPTSQVAEDVVLYPGRPGTDRRVSYFVRAEPAAVEDLYKDVEEKLLAANAGRLVEVKTLHEIKMETYSEHAATMKLFAGMIGLLFIVTSLGIVGLTSFSVTQRYRQIGTRRALGATRTAILRYFLVENWVITGFGLLLGLAVSFGLNQLLVTVADAPGLEWGLLASSLLFFWLVGLMAALLPAMRGMKVSPVIATRTV